MAPSNRKDHVKNSDVKKDMFISVQFSGVVPDSFMTLKSVVQNYGLSLQVHHFLISSVVCYLWVGG